MFCEKTFFLLTLSFSFISCEKLKRYFHKKPQCLSVYKKTFQTREKQNPQLLSKAAEQCLEKQEFSKAIFLLEKLLLDLKPQASFKEIKKIQKQLAEISFYKLNNYEKALKYYTNLLKKASQPAEKFFFQKQMAESFLYLKKYKQALREVNKCFVKNLSLKEEKEAVFLKSRILVEKKAFDQALFFFDKQISRFPEEEVFFREYKAFIYESKKEFLSAVEELEKIEPKSLFIREKIQKLRERQSNQPGF